MRAILKPVLNWATWATNGRQRPQQGINKQQKALEATLPGPFISSWYVPAEAITIFRESFAPQRDALRGLGGTREIKLEVLARTGIVDSSGETFRKGCYLATFRLAGPACTAIGGRS